MSTNFPSALDSFTNPNGSDALNAAAVPHAEQHANANDAIQALQAKVGINGSAVATSLDYRISAAETGLNGKISSSEKGSANGVATLGFDGKVPSSQLPPLDYIPTSAKGAAGGVAGLDEAGKVPAAQLPSYVDDVLEYANLAAFPATGEAGKIYVALDTNKTYRWSGSTYIYITSGAVDSVSGKTGVVVLTKADVGLGNVDNTSDADKPISAATQAALDGLQAQVTGLASSKLDVAAPSFGGNAATATKLRTPRTLTIGNTGKNFDGSADVSWSLTEIGVAPPISVTGPTSAYVSTTVTLTITDLDDFDAYTVTSSHGTVSRSGATITYTAPGAVPGNGVATITIQRGTGQRVLTIQILPAAVLPPTVTVTGAPSDVPESPLIGTSAFQTVGVSDTHASTTWRVRKVADGSVVWESVNNIANKTQITVPSGILQTNTQYRFEAIHNGATLGASDVGYVEATTKAQFAQTIVGLVQVATGGGAGTYVRVDENFAPKATDAAFFNNHPTYSGIVQQTIDGQAMIKIPKFWFKAGTVPSGTYAGKTYWMISDQPVSGFSVHPAFIGAGGVELDQIWIGKYQASSSGGKLQSVPGVLPRVSMDFPTARAEAYARNTGGVSGFRLLSDYDLGAIQMLASIEMGGLDMQSLIGQGRVSQSSAANVDASDVAQATWRGIVGLWGNVWQMVDGIKRNGGNWWRWQYNVPGNTTTSDFATGYVNTGRAALTSSGYPVTFDTTLLSAGIIVPATVDGTASNGSTGDYFLSDTNTDDRIAYHGGDWSYGASAGLFILYVSDAPSTAYISIGARLAKV